MAYCSPEEVKHILTGAATDEDGRSAADLGDASIQLEIENAQAQIDGTLNGTYKVPFDSETVPQLIKSLNIDIAAYLCDLNYRKSREYESDNYPIIRRYNRAREILEWLRTGIMRLPIERAAEDLTGSEVFHAQVGPLFSLEDAFFNRYGGDW